MHNGLKMRRLAGWDVLQKLKVMGGILWVCVCRRLGGTEETSPGICALLQTKDANRCLLLMLPLFRSYLAVFANAAWGRRYGR